jgi:hypothetical protein
MLSRNGKVKLVLFVIGFILGVGLLLYIELDFQKKYQDHREQQKIEHEFYMKHKGEQGG